MYIPIVQAKEYKLIWKFEFYSNIVIAGEWIKYWHNFENKRRVLCYITNNNILVRYMINYYTAV